MLCKVWCSIAVFAVIFAVDLRASEADFNRDIRPILSDNCFHCHGQDPAKRMAGLRLDVEESATEDRGNGPAVKPGSRQESRLFTRITARDASHMPPVYSNRSLTDEQIELIGRWLDQGGKYERHWAFTPPVRRSAPHTSDTGWVKQPIDAFVLARLDAEGLKPSWEAAPETWLRRASLDLIGLPPTAEEMKTFLGDLKASGEAAYARATDRLLGSPRYGERMAMDWLDVSRYADTHGFNNDSSRSMWRWRDWVIDSFNRNMPYDRFITEQLAGDLLADRSLDQLVATGFNRNHVINSEGGIIDEEYRVEYVADRVRTVSMAWLGLSFECARCHDHKYDPITQKDYYRFFAFFNNVPEMGEDGRVANAAPLISAPTKIQQERIQELQGRVDALEVEATAQAAAAVWRPAMARAARKAAVQASRDAPKDTSFRFDCDSGGEGLEDSDSSGISGAPCRSAGPDGAPEPPKLEDHGSMTLSLWLRASEADSETALVSGIDYSPEPSSTKHGEGIELRLAGSEIELRLSTHYPAYSITIRSDGGAIGTGKWHHVAALYSGKDSGPTGRAEAGWVRMFVDGREVRTRVLNDDLHKPAEFASTLLLGTDNSPDARVFEGLLDEVSIWSRALDAAEIRRIFQFRAIPYALAQLNDGEAFSALPEWARRELLAASNKILRKSLTQLDSARAGLFATWRSAPTTMVMEDMEPRRQAHVLERGRYDTPGDAVEPGVPENLLGAWPDAAPRNRLGLARWITQPSHPLTARVVVNRFWQQIFGQGLVKTSENFGFQGEWPSHPELLDWLAVEFVQSGWDVKALLRIVVLSSTYRQDSTFSPALAARDPENRLLARGPRFRLPAELVRDQALALSDLLHDRLGGPSVRPYQPKSFYEGVVVGADYPGTTWEPGVGEQLYRRSLYTFWKRTAPHPAMTVFDAPDREFCTVRRSVTNTPLQALTLLNSPIFVEAARKLAERMMLEGGESVASRVEFAFQLATARRPDKLERETLEGAFHDLLASYDGETKEEAKALLAVGEAPPLKGVSAKQLAAYTMLAGMILNLDEVITKN